jgi:suppressor for copper-sensitivity B
VALGLLLAILAFRRRLPSSRPPSTRRLTGAMAAALAAIALLTPTLRGPAMPVESESATVVTGPWRPFDEAALHGMVAQGKVVFVDVTAAWCLTCKANELAVLDRAPVADRLRNPSVVAMRADWTRPDPIVTAYMQSFGRYGVPLDVVYGPGAPAGIVLPELLTPGAVMHAFERAAAGQLKEATQ